MVVGDGVVIPVVCRPQVSAISNVLEGSVRRVGQRVQANVQLIDTETGAHIWADRFEADRADLAKAQDEIVSRLARRRQLEIVEAATRRIEQEKPTNPDASDFVMRGWAWYYRPITTASLQEAQGPSSGRWRLIRNRLPRKSALLGS